MKILDNQIDGSSGDQLMISGCGLRVEGGGGGDHTVTTVTTTHAAILSHIEPNAPSPIIPYTIILVPITPA